jgi:prephenate dehydrogenase
MQLFILSRFLNQEANLYIDMQTFNTVYKNEIIPEIKGFVEQLSSIINNFQDEKFEQEFNEIKKYI